MLWLILVTASALLMAAGNLIDRISLTTAYKNLFAYGFVSGATNLVFSIALLIVFPFQGNASDFTAALAVSVLYGILNACWYLGLSKGEATRLIPFHSIFPLFTLAWASALIGEQLSSMQVLGILVAVTGAVLITLKDTRIRSLRLEQGVGWILANAALWGLFHVVQKPVLQKISVVNLWGVMGIGFFAVFVASLAFKQTRTELARVAKKPKTLALPVGNEMIYVFSQLALTASLALASPSLVANAENLKLVFLFAFAAVAARFFPSRFKEDLSASALARKLAATALIAFGVWLAAF